MTTHDFTTTRRDSSSTMSRRSAFKVLAGAGATIVALAAGGTAALANHTSQLYTVSVNTNFRTGPGTSYRIITVIPRGATFTLNGQTKNGFAGITYRGQSGWVYASYVVAATSDDQGGNYRTATANLNLRAEPSTSAKVLTVIPKGAQVQLLHTQVGNFANVNYGGYQGWAHLDYLK